MGCQSNTQVVLYIEYLPSILNTTHVIDLVASQNNSSFFQRTKDAISAYTKRIKYLEDIINGRNGRLPSLQIMNIMFSKLHLKETLKVLFITFHKIKIW